MWPGPVFRLNYIAASAAGDRLFERHIGAPRCGPRVRGLQLFSVRRRSCSRPSPLQLQIARTPKPWPRSRATKSWVRTASTSTCSGAADQLVAGGPARRLHSFKPRNRAQAPRILHTGAARLFLGGHDLVPEHRLPTHQMRPKLASSAPRGRDRAPVGDELEGRLGGDLRGLRPGVQRAQRYPPPPPSGMGRPCRHGRPAPRRSRPARASRATARRRAGPRG